MKIEKVYKLNEVAEVTNYPHRGQKTNARFALEVHKKKGYRSISQIQNPKTKEWHKPKKTTWGNTVTRMVKLDNFKISYIGVEFPFPCDYFGGRPWENIEKREEFQKRFDDLIEFCAKYYDSFIDAELNIVLLRLATHLRDLYEVECNFCTNDKTARATFQTPSIYICESVLEANKTKSRTPNIFKSIKMDYAACLAEAMALDKKVKPVVDGAVVSKQDFIKMINERGL